MPQLQPSDLPSAISRPDLPPELQLKAIPLPRPKEVPQDPLPSEDRSAKPGDSPSLVTPAAPQPDMILYSEGSPVVILPSESWQKTQKPAPLLPEPVQDPSIVYVIPFVYLMVPVEVQERIFDRLVDLLNDHASRLQLKFVIFKDGLNETTRPWLESRHRVFGEIYGYVENSGCCSTELRTHTSLTYFRPLQTSPALKHEDSFKTFFDHDQSTLAKEREKLADQIVASLSAELLKTLEVGQGIVPREK